MDLRWLPDGSGFLVARQTDLLDESVNIYAFDFVSRTLTKVTNFAGESVRRFAISPDGQSVVFERVTALNGPSDLWTMRRDGSAMRLLVRGGEAPAW
jgi:Tol biopolymer transport system component